MNCKLRILIFQLGALLLVSFSPNSDTDPTLNILVALCREEGSNFNKVSISNNIKVYFIVTYL